MKHSKIVGGSSAARVIACPGSVKLCAKMPPQKVSKYAEEGTLLHEVIAEILTQGTSANTYIGKNYASVTLTQDMVDEKLTPALHLLQEFDPSGEAEFSVEEKVSFSDFIPGVFGSVDLVGRLGTRAVILDFKFGSGVAVDVEENAQLMFYAAAAMRTKGLEWVFEGVEDIECIIIQPPFMKRWVTTFARIKAFEQQLKAAVDLSAQENAPVVEGSYCRWCTAKPICPSINSKMRSMVEASKNVIQADDVSRYLENAEILEVFISELRTLAHSMLESGTTIPGYKLVAKRASRKWINEDQAAENLKALGLKESEIIESNVISVAVAEKVLKKHKKALPENLYCAISSGTTLATDNDPRPALKDVGTLANLANALAKLPNGKIGNQNARNS